MPRRSEELPRRPAAPPPELWKPVIAQTQALRAERAPDPVKKAAQPESSPDAPAAVTSPSKLPQALLQDISLYSIPQVAPPLVPESASTSLEELAHVVRLSRYQERKCANTRLRLQRCLMSMALSARLTRCGELAYRSMAEYFRKGEAKAFANLYNMVLDIRKSCDEIRQYALLDPEMDGSQSPRVGASESLGAAADARSQPSVTAATIAPFFNDIPAEARDPLMAFLIQLRNNPDYLASRLSALSNGDLVTMSNLYQSLEPVKSVLPGQSGNSTRSSASSAAAANGPQPWERLMSFQRHDPLSTLIHTCFANSAGPDSREDQRRTSVWASACARLINEDRDDSVVASVLHAWTAMRGWSGRSKMEWYLMKILQDGAFILDRAEDPHGTRFWISSWTDADKVAMYEFYDRATADLFEVIDDEDGTGIPEGVIEIGNEILKRVDAKHLDRTRRWLVNQWLFGTWLRNVVIHPERYGMMAEFHITKYGREKILQAVAVRAFGLVFDTISPTGNRSNAASAAPQVKSHIDNILDRFGGGKPRRPTAKLLPARSITSLRETVEVHPYLVICPADLVTLVNTLFPSMRPRSAQSSSIRSGANSISGFSAMSPPISVSIPRAPPDTWSTSGASLSSSMSEAAREPLLEEQRTGTSARSSPPPKENSGQKRPNYEEDGRLLRDAVQYMRQALGPEVVLGSSHPCAERWAVLFVSADGNELSTQMKHDPEDDADDESTSDTDDEVDDVKPELDKDYHQLRDSILRLVEEYEIPQAAGSQDGKMTTFSMRATNLKQYRSRNRVVTPAKTPSSNPFRRRAEARRQKEGSGGHSGVHVDPETGKPAPPQPEAEIESVLVSMLKSASSQAEAQSDFNSAHLYWKTLQQLNNLASASLRKNGFAALLNIFARGPRDYIGRSAFAIEDYEAWLVWLKQSQERSDGLIEVMMRRLRALRDKMWFSTGVHNSKPYDNCRNIAAALKTMGPSRRWEPHQFEQIVNRVGPAAYIHTSESQTLKLLAATEAEGGPNKLSNDQVDITDAWLEQSEIYNFCQGEERIHRFCYEIEKCVGKLIGEGMVEAPDLWSSELYARDRRIFDSTKATRDRDSQSWGEGSSVISDLGRRFRSSRPAPTTARNLRAISGYNFSQQSFDSGRDSFSRASALLSEPNDGPDYFGASSPVSTADASAAYWSPFQTVISPSSTTSRAHSPTTSITNLSSAFSFPLHSSHGFPPHSQVLTGRPGTSASSETVYQQRLSEEKTRFLTELRHTLTGLLISDLGNLVFARGSETDSWFADLGQDCIDRRESQRAQHGAAKEKQRAKRSSLTQRIMEKKRSFGDLRTAAGGASSPTSSTGPPSSRGNDSSAGTSDTITVKNGEPRSPGTPDFPFTKAYQQLLRMFCVHPNPYTKLKALFDLQQLIAASLNSGSTRRKVAWLSRSDAGSSASTEDQGGGGPSRTRPLEQAVDKVKERRTQALVAPLAYAGGHSGGGNAETRSIMTVNPANSDAISTVLQSLFRDAGIRPKTLFRDLQFIASFVPPSVLEKSDRGNAFWDTALAAMKLKYEVCKTMIEVADGIVGFYQQTQTRKTAPPSAAPNPTADARDAAATGNTPSSAAAAASQCPARSSPPHRGTPFGYADAAHMWTITAKEGDPTAQRELALFYMSSPELVERTTLPLSRPRDVWRPDIIEKYRGFSSGGTVAGPGGASGGAGAGAAGKGSIGDERPDTELMCVAVHWMRAAGKGGDRPAKSFLEQHGIKL